MTEPAEPLTYATAAEPQRVGALLVGLIVWLLLVPLYLWSAFGYLMLEAPVYIAPSATEVVGAAAIGVGYVSVAAIALLLLSGRRPPKWLALAAAMLLMTRVAASIGYMMANDVFYGPGWEMQVYETFIITSPSMPAGVACFVAFTSIRLASRIAAVLACAVTVAGVGFSVWTLYTGALGTPVEQPSFTTTLLPALFFGSLPVAVLILCLVDRQLRPATCVATAACIVMFLGLAMTAVVAGLRYPAQTRFDLVANVVGGVLWVAALLPVALHRVPLPAWLDREV